MDVTPLSCAGERARCELVHWPPNSSRPGVRIERWLVKADHSLDPVADHDRLFILVRGEGVTVTHGEEAPRSHLRKFETHSVLANWPVELELGGGPVEARVRAQALQLGTRGVREELDAAQVLLYVPSGALVARLTGEEEPFELEAGDGLWLRGLRGNEEVALEGSDPECGVVLVGVTGTGT